MKRLFTLLFLLATTLPYAHAQLTNDIGWDIGTTWTYEVLDYVGIGQPPTAKFVTYEIVKDTVFAGEAAYKVQTSGFFNLVIFMQVEGSRVSFYNAELDAYKLHYDFANDTSYETIWTIDGSGPEPQGVAIANIDSVTTVGVGSDQLAIQHIRFEYLESEQTGANIENDINKFKPSYRNIGQLVGGLPIQIGDELAIYTWEWSRIRCFENDFVSYNFVGFPV